MAAPVFCVLHVPKCAGETIQIHLQRQLGQEGFWLASKRVRKFPLEFLGRKYDKRLPNDRSKIKAVSGHFIGGSIEKEFPDRQIKRVVLLRRPIDLLLSWYNFRMMRYISKGEAPYPFALHIGSLASNPVANFLLERWLELPLWRLMSLNPRQKVEHIDQAISQFDFVGDINDCDELVNFIADELGIDGKADRQNTQAAWCKRVEWTPLLRGDLSEQTHNKIRRLTQIDEYLWRRWVLKENISFEQMQSESAFIHEIKRPYFEIRRRLQRSYADRKRTAGAQH